jgi:hypothetical protein
MGEMCVLDRYSRSNLSTCYGTEDCGAAPWMPEPPGPQQMSICHGPWAADEAHCRCAAVCSAGMILSLWGDPNIVKARGSIKDSRTGSLPLFMSYPDDIHLGIHAYTCI